MMKRRIWIGLAIAVWLTAGAAPANAQSGIVRPRRVRPATETTETPSSNSGNDNTATVTPTPRPRTNPTPAPAPTRPPVTNNNGGATVTPATANNGIVKGDTTRAFSLLQQKEYAAALTEARKVTTQFPNDPEAWKIAGFAQLSLNQYAPAAVDLQKAYDLLRAAGKEEATVSFTFDALAQAYFLAEQYGKALPLLITATNRVSPKADITLLFYRGVAEFRAGKVEDAEKTFNQVIKANPKDTGALFYLGQFAYEKSDMTACINLLNRVTVIDPNTPDAWRLLASAYQRRASTETDATQAEADYLGAVRAGEQLSRRSQTTEDTLLYAQALIGAKQYAKAVPLLDKAAAAKPTDGRIFFLLGAAQLRANNMPKAILAFEQAAKLTPKDTNVYRELGYAYEVQKQYAKALAAYQKGAALAPNDQYFQEAVTRVKPYAK